MKTALSKGTVNLEGKRAPRLQPQDPWIHTQPPSLGSPLPSTPASRAHQATNTKNVIAPDGSEPIINRGQARKCIKAIPKVIRDRHGLRGCFGREAIDYFRAVAGLEDVVAAGDPKYIRSLPKFAKRWCPYLSEAEQAEALAEVRDGSFVVTARWLGELLCLTDEMRDRLKFYDAEAFDMSDADRLEKRKAKEAARQRDRRKQLGATPRNQCLARLREQQCPNVSERTFYCRMERDRTAR